MQEALTNALRHARTSAAVHISRDSGLVVVDVRNPMIADVPVNGYGAGRGLACLRERVRVYDGELTARADGDQWVLRATLPLGGVDR